MKAQAIKPDTLRPSRVTSARPLLDENLLNDYVNAETATDDKAKAHDRSKAKAQRAALALLAVIPADTEAGIVVGILNGCAGLRLHMAGSAADRGLTVGKWFNNSGLRAALLSRGWKIGAASVKGAEFATAEAVTFRIPDPARAAGGTAKAANTEASADNAADDTGTDSAGANTSPAPAPYSAEQCAAALSALSPAEAARLLVAAFGEADEADAFASAVMQAAGWELEAEQVQALSGNPLARAQAH